MSENQSERRKASILAVDDTPDNLRLLIGILAKRGYEVRVANNGDLALKSVQSFLPDLILLDIKMPGMDGYQVCKQLKADERTCDISVIFLSALSEAMDKVKGFALGGVDYITKPFQAEEVFIRVETHLALRNLQKHLQAENTRRQQAEKALQQANELLEERVKTRTAELEMEMAERTRVEQVLRASEQQYRLLVEHVADGIGIIQHNRLVFANDALAAMFGVALQQLLGKNPAKLFRSADNDDAATLPTPQGNEESPSWHVVEFTTGAGEHERWMEERRTSILWEGAPANLMTVRDITEHKRKEDAINDERKQLQRENIRLRSTMKDRYRFHDIIGRSPAMQQVYELIARASATNANVVIYGETGTGKDLVAQTIHALSERRNKQFIAVNCGSIQESLFEREFFGHRKGAFTGAIRDQGGFFDAAHQGTLFLDEVGELTLTMQIKLLRALEDGGYTPVGAQVAKHADVRIVAATNRDLPERVKQGEMREDFFYRIHIITIMVPPLRERREDIPLLIDHFLKQYTKGEAPPVLPGHVLELLYKHDWPGNIRQIQNVLQRYLTLKYLDFDDGIVQQNGESDTRHLTSTLSFTIHENLQLHDALEECEKQLLLKALHHADGHRKTTAKALGIPLRTLQRKLKSTVCSIPEAAKRWNSHEFSSQTNLNTIISWKIRVPLMTPDDSSGT